MFTLIPLPNHALWWMIPNLTSTQSSKKDLVLSWITILQRRPQTPYRAYQNNNKRSNLCLLYSGKNIKQSISNSLIKHPNTPKYIHSISQLNRTLNPSNLWPVITNCLKKIPSLLIKGFSTCWYQNESKVKSKTISLVPPLMSLPTKSKRA